MENVYEFCVDLSSGTSGLAPILMFVFLPFQAELFDAALRQPEGGGVADEQRGDQEEQAGKPGTETGADALG